MGKKKGKDKNKLARMSEEERIRYLQHRAELEEEAKRRKQQLISTFMKVKNQFSTSSNPTTSHLILRLCTHFLFYKKRDARSTIFETILCRLYVFLFSLSFYSFHISLYNFSFLFFFMYCRIN